MRVLIALKLGLSNDQLFKKMVTVAVNYNFKSIILEKCPEKKTPWSFLHIWATLYFQVFFQSSWKKCHPLGRFRRQPSRHDGIMNRDAPYMEMSKKKNLWSHVYNVKWFPNIAAVAVAIAAIHAQ